MWLAIMLEVSELEDVKRVIVCKGAKRGLPPRIIEKMGLQTEGTHLECVRTSWRLNLAEGQKLIG